MSIFPAIVDSRSRQKPKLLDHFSSNCIKTFQQLHQNFLAIANSFSKLSDYIGFDNFKLLESVFLWNLS